MSLLGGSDCILMYHGTPSVDATALERQLRALGLARKVVPLAELAQGGPRNGRARVALTFDDGLRSNVEVAYPILRRLGLTATFYVCPGLVESGEWLWNHEARERLHTLAPSVLDELARSVGAPIEIEAFVEWLKTLKLAARKRVEAQIRAATPRFKATPEQRAQFDVARWRDLKVLDPRTVTIGSHTMTHPILTSLSPDEMEIELRDSREALEERLARPVRDFCYPNGELDAGVVDTARRYYGSAVTVESGSLEGDVDPYRMPRFATHPRFSLRLARRLAFG